MFAFELYSQGFHEDTKFNTGLQLRSGQGLFMS